jgi:hypothetical protein
MTDKIIFWIDPNLVYFGIAKYLQEQHDCELYAVIDVPVKQKNFFETQTLVKFKRNWFFFDHVFDTKELPDMEFLSNFEKKYDVNLWLLAYNERLFYNYNDYHTFTENEVLKIIEQECRFFEKVLDDAKPDFIIMAAPNLHYNFLFSKMCMARNIKILMLGGSRFGNRCILSHELDSVDSTFTDENMGPERTHSELINYLNSFNLYDDNEKLKKRFVNSKIDRVRSIIKFLFSTNDKRKTYSYYGRTKLKIIFKTIEWIIRENYRLFFINRNLVKDIKNSEPFVFFPLQVNIESTLLIYAPFFTNPLEQITNIVKSLPVGYKLYVKDHPLQNTRGWRDIEFYKNVMNLPNVKFIHHSVNSEEILKKSSLVITVNSTAGMEAALHKKPTITLSDTLYSVLPSVYRLKNFEELPKIIRSALKITVNISDVNKFVNFIHKNSIDFNLQKFTMDAEEYFYYGGYLVNQNISEEKMKSYLDKNSSQFNQLVLEHIKKLNPYSD